MEFKLKHLHTLSQTLDEVGFLFDKAGKPNYKILLLLLWDWGEHFYINILFNDYCLSFRRPIHNPL